MSEDQLILALDSSDWIGTWEWDISSDRIYSDRRFAKLFSVDPARAASGAPSTEFTNAIHPEDRPKLVEAVRQTPERGGDSAIECRIPQADGTVSWVCSRGRCRMDEAGNPTRYAGVAFDISDRKRAEVMLAEKARLAALGADIGAALVQNAELPAALQRCAEAIVGYLDAAFARVWTLAPAGNVLELQASAGLYTHLNGPHSHVPVGAYKIGLIARDRQPHLTNDVAHDSRVSDPAWAEREGMVAFAGYPLLVEDRLLGVVGLFARHTLAEYTIEALASVSTIIALGIERKRAEAALAESEKRYRFLAESMPQMVWTATPAGALDYVSGQAGTYFGQPLESLLGSGWLYFVHPEERDHVVERWQSSLKSGEPYEVEFRLRRGSDGAWRWFLARAHSMPSVDGTSDTSDTKVAGWVGTCTDIHEQKQGQEALSKANRELEEFAYVASHDLQEPLRMINIYTQMLLRRLAIDDPVLEQYAGFVNQGVRRMETLLRDLLSFSRSIHAEPFTTGTADLSASLTEALSVLKTRIDESGCLVNAQPLPATRGDTLQLAHVFQNLIANSLKYRGEAVPIIDIAAKLKGNRWIVSVRDNGIGFDPRYAERIFGLFKRLHKEEYPGTGLGLAICQRIVERYGGSIWAEGELGEGATFYFSLPCADETLLNAVAEA